MRRSSVAILLSLLGLLASSASAHTADLLYCSVERAPDGATVTEKVTLTAATLSLLVPLPNAELTAPSLEARRAAIEAGVWDAMPLASRGGPCSRRDTLAAPRDSFVELTAHFTCPPGELTQTFRLLSVLPPNYRAVVATDAGQRFAQGSEQTVVVPERTAEPAAAQEDDAPTGLWGWIGLGIKHIFTGYDHLCFLVALLLVGGTWRRVLWMVTSFTLAHSITLGATALGWVALDSTRQRWVEMAIAASIIYVAAENLVRREHRHRAWVTFGFGLVHGFGFASVLQSYGLGDSVASALFGFNVGVEVGQACVVAALFPLVRLLQRREALGTWTTRVASVAILAAGGFWLVDRALG